MGTGTRILHSPCQHTNACASRLAIRPPCSHCRAPSCRGVALPIQTPQGRQSLRWLARACFRSGASRIELVIHRQSAPYRASPLPLCFSWRFDPEWYCRSGLVVAVLLSLQVRAVVAVAFAFLGALGFRLCTHAALFLSGNQGCFGSD